MVRKFLEIGSEALGKASEYHGSLHDRDEGTEAIFHRAFIKKQ
jgi:hypothetical protein